MERISQRQAVLIGVISTFDVILVNTFSLLTIIAKQDSWLVVPLTALPMIGVVWMLGRVSARFPDLDLFAALTLRWPVLGRLIVMGYLGLFLFLLARDSRMLTEFIGINLLPATPRVVVLALIALTAALIARGGVETTARVTEFFTPVMLLLALSVPLMVSGQLESRHMLPILAEGPAGVLTGVWLSSAFFGEVMLVPILMTGRVFKFRTGVLAVLISALFVELLFICNLLVLGPEVPEQTTYASYELVRLARLTDFLDRWDMIYVGVWMPTMLAKIAIFLQVILRGMLRVVPELDTRLLAIPLASVCLAIGAWVFGDALQVFQINLVQPVITNIFFFLLPLLFLIFLRPGPGAANGADSSRNASSG